MPDTTAPGNYVMKPETLAEMYARLSIAREPVLARARTYCEYVMPYLLPPLGATDATPLVEPFSSTAARGATSLTNKLLLSLFPVNTSFIRLEPDLLELASIAQADPAAKDEIVEALRTSEDAATKEIERRGWRPSLHHALLLDVITGNHGMWFRKKDDALSVYGLDQYVAAWDSEGSMTEMIVCERINYRLIPEHVRSLMSPKDSEGRDYTSSSELSIFSGVVLQSGGKFRFWQEVGGAEIPGSSEDGIDPLRSPLRAVRYTVARAQDYGRGRVEVFSGDIKSLDGLSQALLEASAVCARVVFGVKPTSYSSITELNRTANGGYIHMAEGDVFAVSVDKYADLQVVRQAREDLVASVSFAFLLNTSIQREAERVTAAEIAFMAQELEDTLGGAYSILKKELQLPIATMVLDSLEKSGRIPKLPSTVRVNIVTGVEALGRNHELNRLGTAMQSVTAAGVPAEIAFQSIDATELVRRIFESSGVETRNLLRSRAEIQANADKASSEALVRNIAPDLVKSGASMLTNAQNNATAAATQQ